MCTKLQVLHWRVAEHTEVHPVELVQLHHLLHAQLGEILGDHTPCKGVIIRRRLHFQKRNNVEIDHCHFLPLLTCGDTVCGPSGSDPDVREDCVLAHVELLHHLLHVLAQSLSLATAQTFR